jgi:hypothetical protein
LAAWCGWASANLRQFYGKKYLLAMGWEWRVFYAGNVERQFLALAEAELPLVEPDVASSKSDSRFDVYVSVSEDTGVKVRGDLSSPEIEVKTRKERKRKGLEKWRKVFA